MWRGRPAPARTRVFIDRAKSGVLQPYQLRSVIKARFGPLYWCCLVGAEQDANWVIELQRRGIPRWTAGRTLLHLQPVSGEGREAAPFHMHQSNLHGRSTRRSLTWGMLSRQHGADDVPVLYGAQLQQQYLQHQQYQQQRTWSSCGNHSRPQCVVQPR